MVRVSLPRAARTAAAGAFIFALSVTSLGGNAAASPSAEEDGQKGCSALAHVRNDATSNLREAWQGFRKQARDLAHDARELRKENVDRAALAAATTELKDANESLDGIRNSARDEMRAIFAATVCKVATAAAGNPVMTFIQVRGHDEDGLKVRVQFSEKVSCSGDCAMLFTFGAAKLEADEFKLDEDGASAKLTFGMFENDEDDDKDANKDEKTKDQNVKVSATDKLTFTAGAAGALKDRDGNAMASQTVGPVDVAPLAAELAKKLKDVVDKAVKDMQVVTDGLKATVAAMLNAAGVKPKTDDEDKDHKKARERAEKAKDALKRAEDVLNNGTLDGDKAARERIERAKDALKRTQDMLNNPNADALKRAQDALNAAKERGLNADALKRAQDLLNAAKERGLNADALKRAQDLLNDAKLRELLRTGTSIEVRGTPPPVVGR